MTSRFYVKIGHAVSDKCVHPVEITQSLNPKVINAICFLTPYAVQCSIALFDRHL